MKEIFIKTSKYLRKTNSSTLHLIANKKIKKGNKYLRKTLTPYPFTGERYMETTSHTK
jgi:hypothetical protein